MDYNMSMTSSFVSAPKILQSLKEKSNNVSTRYQNWPWEMDSKSQIKKSNAALLPNQQNAQTPCPDTKWY